MQMTRRGRGAADQHELRPLYWERPQSIVPKEHNIGSTVGLEHYDENSEFDDEHPDCMVSGFVGNVLVRTTYSSHNKAHIDFYYGGIY